MNYASVSSQIRQVAVIGAGLMGHALALVHALGGCSVMLHDNNAVVLNNARDLISNASNTLCDSGVLDVDAACDAQARIELTGSLCDAVLGADLVVEAVLETPEVKQNVFAEIDQFAPDHAIIASNTSHLDIFPLIPETRQTTAIIAHWYTPPYIIDLVDIAPGPMTHYNVVARITELYRDFGKQPLVFDVFIPGYIANRLQAALNLECLRMVDEGWATAKQIDHSILHGLALRFAVLGHMRKLDYTGLHVVQAGLVNQTYDPPKPAGYSATLSQLIAEGRKGVTTGAGFFDYAGEPPEQLFEKRDKKLLQLKGFLAENMKGDKNDQS